MKYPIQHRREFSFCHIVIGTEFAVISDDDARRRPFIYVRFRPMAGCVAENIGGRPDRREPYGAER